MTRIPRALALPAAGLLLSTALAGCGGGDSSSVASPREWTSALCKSLTPLVAHGTALQSDLGGKAQQIATNPAGVRDEFAKNLGQLADDFEAGLAAARKAGAPDVKNGEQIQKDVLDGLSKAAKVFKDAETKVAAAKPDAQAVTSAVLAVSQSITDGFESFGTAFDKLDKDDELAKEGDENPDCKALNMS